MVGIDDELLMVRVMVRVVVRVMVSVVVRVMVRVVATCHNNIWSRLFYKKIIVFRPSLLATTSVL